MIRSTFADLDAWGLRLMKPWQPDPGTPLEQDDLDWPPFPVTQVAVAGLGSARDHLQAVRVHIDAGSGSRTPNPPCSAPRRSPPHRLCGS